MGRSSSASTASGEAVSSSWADEPVEDEELTLEADSFCDIVEPAESIEETSTFEYDGWARSREFHSQTWRVNGKADTRHCQWNAVGGRQNRTWRSGNWRW